MKVSNLQDALQMASGYKLVALGVAGQSENVMAWNKYGAVPEKIKEIKDFFAKNLNDPNLDYIVKVRNSTKARETILLLDNGNKERIQELKDNHYDSRNTNTIPFSKFESVLDELSEYKIRCAELESENAVLLSRIEDLKAEIDGLNQDLDGDLSDGGGDTTKQLMNMLLAKVVANSDQLLEKFIPGFGQSNQNNNFKNSENE